MKISTAQERIKKNLSEFFDKQKICYLQESAIHKDTNSLRVRVEFIDGKTTNRYSIDRFIPLEEIDIEPDVHDEFSILHERIEQLIELIDNQIKSTSERQSLENQYLLK